MKYYILYKENYLPILISKCRTYIRYNEEDKIEELISNIRNNKFLTDKQKEEIIKCIEDKI